MRRPPSSRGRQTGAVLYVALIMLVLLALLGVVAMQVAGLQERMSANYQAASMAFQNAEGVVRTHEIALADQVRAGTLPPTNLPPTDCATPHDAAGWTDRVPHVRRLDLCFSWGGLDYPSDQSERTDQIYQVTAHARDRDGVFASSEAVIDTVFIP
ncbi:protein PilX [Luteimonas sp. Y-2-2-4F]|nr:PilX N-terminal domain-containing pilus assembly protein [Luteimonas sp. Y-2-2-4F]MCD9030689.1 protein PilX [Luteimonas sp. Y-2-2-4F]